MGLNSTPNGERIHIGIFGKRNAGKSSVINALTSQNLAIISDTAGTTTDPVSKAMEILPLGPVLITDTPGFDDEGDLGKLRVEKCYEVLRKIHFAIIVLNGENIASEGYISIFSDDEKLFIEEIKKRNVSYIICINKIDLCSEEKIKALVQEHGLENIVYLSAKTCDGIDELKNRIAFFTKEKDDRHVIADLVEKGDTVVLVVPIDESAPKGRLILPQQQVIRDLLEASATAVVTKETELASTLEKLKDKPKVVVTDSQAFKYVSEIVPEDIELTSFSILMARYKGDLDWQVAGAEAIEHLENGAKVLISEGCTHHRQCGDIGTVKLPNWIREYTNKDFDFSFSSGSDFPEDISEYDLIVHCGGCTLNEQEMKYRISKAKEAGVPITNYGVLISYVNGILKRSLHLLTYSDK